MGRHEAPTAMARIHRPTGDPGGSASSHADADRPAPQPIDWQRLSHELRTPLNAILGNVELLLDGSAGPLSAEARTCLGEIQAAGHHLLRQVQVLLAWSERSGRGPELASRPVDLIALVREALTIGHASPARIEPADACLQICADPFWLQALLAEIAALGVACRAAPVVRLERRAGRGTLDFAWPGLGAAGPAPLHMTLIEAIARLQGAAVARRPDGLALHWPLEPA